MKSASQAKTALIVIDVQNGFKDTTHWGSSRNNPACEDNIAKLITAARDFNKKSNVSKHASTAASIEICHVHHHSTEPDSKLYPGTQITTGSPNSSPNTIYDAVAAQDFANPQANESVFVKNVNSAFIGTQLEQHLRQHQVQQLVICGLTTDHCVSTTTRMASNLRVTAIDGKRQAEVDDVLLVGDACATFAKREFDAETVHRVNLASLDGEFAKVVSTGDVVDAVFA